MKPLALVLFAAAVLAPHAWLGLRFHLEPAGEGRTRVRLTGAGYADSEAGRALLGFFRDGNRVSLERLRRRFASGPIDWSREQAAR